MNVKGILLVAQSGFLILFFPLAQDDGVQLCGPH